MVISLPTQTYFGKKFAARRDITAKMTDDRVLMTSEVNSGVYDAVFVLLSCFCP
jgi:hypothetical protein